MAASRECSNAIVTHNGCHLRLPRTIANDCQSIDVAINGVLFAEWFRNQESHDLLIPVKKNIVISSGSQIARRTRCRLRTHITRRAGDTVTQRCFTTVFFIQTVSVCAIFCTSPRFACVLPLFPTWLAAFSFQFAVQLHAWLGGLTQNAFKIIQNLLQNF